jgi:anthranilate phosphoribosyltransferase
LDAVSFYPDLKELSEVRKTLGFKTIFDLVFPLLNPFPLTGQLVGVYTDEVIPLMIQTLKSLGRRRALVVHGQDGTDEISVCANTHVAKLEQGQIVEETWKPEDFGFARYHCEELVGFHVEQNARVVEKVMAGKAPPAIQSTAVLNAGAVLWCAELCTSVHEGVHLVQAAIAKGEGVAFLKAIQG